MSAPAPANDYTSPGQDFYDALMAEAGETRAITVLAQALYLKLDWRALTPAGREVFERAAVRFLSEP